MVEEKNKLIKMIKSYEDLKNSKPGELILINGGKELLIPSDNVHSAKFGYNKDNICTISVDGEYIVQNQYNGYNKDEKDYLKPFMKTACRIDSDTVLGGELYLIAKQGGLL